MKSAQQVFLCSLAFLPIANVQAKEVNTNGLDFGLSADYGSSDNAKRTSVEELAITEIQTVYQATVDAHFQNEWSKLIFGYEASKEMFQQASQPDATELEGKTQLTLGNDYQPLSLTINHSRIAMLDSPDALDLARNRDTQEIITVAPAVKARVSAADSIVVMGSYTNVSYKKEQQKKSEQQGLQMAWIRGVSETDTIQIAVQNIDTTFEFVPQADYQLQDVSAQYSVRLKRLSYTIQAGYNRAELKSSVEDFASPTYKVETSYISGAHTFTFSVAESITNSSMGGSNPSLGGIGSAAGAPAKSVGIDLINVRKSNLSWRTTAICERCDFEINASQSAQDYKELREDGNEYGAGTYFKYIFTRAVSIDFSYSHRERKFSAEGDRASFGSDEAKVGLNYEITRGLKLELYANQEKRKSVMNALNYQENIAGLKLSYHF